MTADAGESRLDGAENAGADGSAACAQRFGGGLCAVPEMLDRHAVAFGENMDIAGFRRLDLVAAGGDEGPCGNIEGGLVHAAGSVSG